MTDPTPREVLRATISDAYYETRNDGGTMETAADRAADAVYALTRREPLDVEVLARAIDNAEDEMARLRQRTHPSWDNTEFAPIVAAEYARLEAERWFGCRYASVGGVAVAAADAGMTTTQHNHQHTDVGLDGRPFIVRYDIGCPGCDAERTTAGVALRALLESWSLKEPTPKLFALIEAIEAEARAAERRAIGDLDVQLLKDANQAGRAAALDEAFDKVADVRFAFAAYPGDGADGDTELGQLLAACLDAINDLRGVTNG